MRMTASVRTAAALAWCLLAPGLPQAPAARPVAARTAAEATLRIVRARRRLCTQNENTCPRRRLRRRLRRVLVGFVCGVFSFFGVLVVELVRFQLVLFVDVGADVEFGVVPVARELALSGR